MAIPTFQGAGGPSANAASVNISIGAPVTGDVLFVAVVTEAQALPTTTAQTPKFINAADSQYTAFPGNPYNVPATLNLYVFWVRYDSATYVTHATGDSGNFQIQTAAYVTGAVGTGTPTEAVASGSGTTDATGILTVPSLTTLGADRLVMGYATVRVDSASNQFTATWINANLANPTTANIVGANTNLSSGGGVAGFGGGKAAAGATGATTHDTTANSTAFGYVTWAVPPAVAAVIPELVMAPPRL